VAAQVAPADLTQKATGRRRGVEEQVWLLFSPVITYDAIEKVTGRITPCGILDLTYQEAADSIAPETGLKGAHAVAQCVGLEPARAKACRRLCEATRVINPECPEKSS